MTVIYILYFISGKRLNIDSHRVKYTIILATDLRANKIVIMGMVKKEDYYNDKNKVDYKIIMFILPIM